MNAEKKHNLHILKKLRKIVNKANMIHNLCEVKVGRVSTFVYRLKGKKYVASAVVESYKNIKGEPQDRITYKLRKVLSSIPFYENIEIITY